MNIGIDVRKFSDYGIGTHIRQVVLPAAQLSPQHEFFLYCDPQDSIDCSPNQHRIEEPAAKYSIQEHYRLAGKAKRNHVDLFHSPHYTLPLLLQIPGIVTIHDLIHFKFQEYFPFWKVQAAKFVMQKAVRKARDIVTVSKTTRDDLLHWMPELEDKVSVIYNRVDGQWFAAETPFSVRSLGIADDFILYVGNFKKHKGIDTLIEAYSRTPDLPQLVLVGQGSQADHELTRRILSTPGTRMLGFAGIEVLKALFLKALLFVFPSRYEGFGYPPLEAMAAGCPVLSSDAPALKEILGTSAEFFECGNAEDLNAKLNGLLQDADRRRLLGRQGIAQANKFASDESLHKITELWNRKD